METNRRQFIAASVKGGLAAALPLSAHGPSISGMIPAIGNTDYSRLDEILKSQVLCFFAESFFQRQT